MSREPEQIFRRYMDGRQTQERCLASLIIREMQIKTTIQAQDGEGHALTPSYEKTRITTNS